MYLQIQFLKVVILLLCSVDSDKRRAFFLESLLGMIAEDELQASGLRATYITTEYMMTITTGNSFVHFCIATHFYLYEYLSNWKDSLSKSGLTACFKRV